MPKNEEGEFELVLGNKQLLSVFFIVVILLGVFFTMGYVVGRNSAPLDATARPGESGGATTSAALKTPSQIVVDPPTRTAEATTPSSGIDPNATPTTATPPPGVTAPQTRTEAQRPPAPNSAPAPGEVITPQPGDMYVQVLALAKPEAEVLVDVLSKKGFHAAVAPGPNDRLFRLLVGPAKDATDLAKLRNDVEAAGFKGAFPKKY